MILTIVGLKPNHQMSCINWTTLPANFNQDHISCQFIHIKYPKCQDDIFMKTRNRQKYNDHNYSDFYVDSTRLFVNFEEINTRSNKF